MTLLLLLVLAALLCVQQFVLLPALKIEVARRGLPGSPSSLLTVLTTSHRLDWLAWLIAPILPVLGLAWIEVRRGALRGLLRDACASPGRSLLLLAGIVAVLTRFYLEPGIPHQYDAKLHYMQAAETLHLLREPALPLYSFTYYGGFPIHHFQGPLLYLLQAPFALILGSVSAGLTLLLWLLHTGSALTTWRFARTIGGSPRAALFAGLGVALSFLHVHEVALSGRYPVALVYFLFPLLLTEAELLASRPGLRRGLRFGALVALLVWSHPGLAPYGVLLALLYLGIRALAADGRLRRFTALLLPGLAAGVLCLALCAGLLYGALSEMDGVQLGAMHSGGGFQIDTSPDLGRALGLLRWRMSFDRQSVNYLGLSLAALFLVGLLRGGGRPGLRTALVLPVVAALFLSGGSYLSSRSVHFLVIFVAAGAGLAMDRLPARVAFPVLLLLLLDLGPGTLQSPLRPDLGYDIRFLERAGSQTGDARALRVSVRNGDPAVSQWAPNYETGLPLVTGPFREASPDAYPLILDLLSRLESDLATGGDLSPETRLGLRVLGVETILAEDGLRPVALDIPGLPAEADPPRTPVPGASPVVAVLSEAAGEAFTSFVPGDWATFSRDGPSEVLGPAGSGVRLLHREFHPSRVLLEYEASRPGRLLLSYQHHPGLRVEMDGRPVDVSDSGSGLALVPTEVGVHRLRIDWSPPRGLAVAWLVSGAAVIFLVVALLFLSARRRSAARTSLRPSSGTGPP